MAGIENSARNFCFLVIICLNGRACVCCSVKGIFAVFLTVCTVEQYIIKENLFTYAAVVGFKARRSRVIRAARELKACGHNVLNSLVAVFTVYYCFGSAVFIDFSDFGLIDISSSGRIGCCFAAVRRIYARSEHRAAVDIVFAAKSRRLVNSEGIASNKQSIGYRSTGRVNNYRLRKLNFLVIILVGICFSFIRAVPHIHIGHRLVYTEILVGLRDNGVGFGAHKLKRYADISLEMVKVNGTVV